MPYSDNFNLKWRSMFVSKSLPWFHKTVRKSFKINKNERDCNSWSLFLISFNKSFCLILDLDDPSLSVIHDKYLTCLRTFTKKHFPNQPNRVEELLVRLPEVSSLSWNEYLWCHGKWPWNVSYVNHLNHLFLLFFTGQESCLSFVGVQNVLRAILIKLVGWIIPHNVRDIPCSRSASAILRTSQICYKLPPKVFVISSSYKLFKNAERVNIACLIGFSNNTSI